MDAIIGDAEIDVIHNAVRNSSTPMSESYLLSYVLKADMVMTQQTIMISELTSTIGKMERRLSEFQTRTTKGLALLESKFNTKFDAIESTLIQPDGMMARSMENMISSKFPDLQAMSYDMSKIQADMAIVVNAVKGYTLRTVPQEISPASKPATYNTKDILSYIFERFGTTKLTLDQLNEVTFLFNHLN